jgi:hypothetical protein
MLRNKLSVPNIYIEPHFPFITTDVLAIDRAGSGDLHAVDIKLEDAIVRKSAPAKIELLGRGLNARETVWMELNIRKTIRTVSRMAQGQTPPAHYRYLAIPKTRQELLEQAILPHLYDSGGIGRIGIISVTERGEDFPIVELSIAPERFRVDPVKLRNIEKKLLEKVRPDIEVRI